MPILPNPRLYLKRPVSGGIVEMRPMTLGELADESELVANKSITDFELLKRRVSSCVKSWSGFKQFDENGKLVEVPFSVESMTPNLLIDISAEIGDISQIQDDEAKN